MYLSFGDNGWVRDSLLPPVHQFLRKVGEQALTL